jgi:hypothetical protein
MGTNAKRPLLIGWKEYIDFPDWGVRHIKIKIDTGARTSALGVVSYQLWQEPAHGLMAELRVALSRRHPDRIAVVEMPVLRMVVVSNSGGMKEQRPLIQTRVRLGRIVKTVALTVTNRASMLFPVILGRKALEGDFVVDVSQKYLLRNRETRKGERGA